MTTEQLSRELLDDDGENRAVRCFLMLYGGTNSPTTKQMRNHLKACGYSLWPQWASGDDDHLTKGGAQDWLRYLFGMESQLPAIQSDSELIKALHKYGSHLHTCCIVDGDEVFEDNEDECDCGLFAIKSRLPLKPIRTRKLQNTEEGHSASGDFDAWYANPYTKVLIKSIDEDYVPRVGQLSSHPIQPAPEQPVYVEVRECSGCGHIGINDSPDDICACNTCDWVGLYQVEDHCPACNRDGTMTSACPKCRDYKTNNIAEKYLPISATRAPERIADTGETIQPAISETDLPPLPHTSYNGCGDGSEPLYTAEYMQLYALAAIEHVGQPPEAHPKCECHTADQEANCTTYCATKHADVIGQPPKGEQQ